MFLTHDPARQFANPYAYGPWDPVNGTDPTGTVFWWVVGIAVVAGAAANAIQAAVSGAPGGEIAGAAVTGALSSGVSAGIGFAVVGPALNATLVPAIVSASGWGQEVVRQAVALTTIGGSVGQAAYGLSQGDYSGLIGLGLTIGLTYAFAGVAQGGDGTDNAGASSAGNAGETYAEANAAGVQEVRKAKELGYVPERHDWKLLHAGRTYHWTLKATQFLLGTNSGPVGYLGRLLITPFVTVGGIGYELHAAFNPFGERFFLDQQSIPDWLFDTAGDLIANTYGQAVALTPGLSPAGASAALRAVGWIPGPNHVSGEGFFRVSRPGLGF